MKWISRSLLTTGIFLIAVVIWQDDFYKSPKENLLYQAEQELKLASKKIKKFTVALQKKVSHELARIQPLPTKIAKIPKGRNLALQRSQPNSPKRAKRKLKKFAQRGFIDLKPYKEIHATNTPIAMASEQERNAYLISQFGMTQKEAEAFEKINKKFAEKISGVVLSSDRQGMDSKSVQKVIGITETRDAWLKRRLGESRYQEFLEFEENQFYNGEQDPASYTHNF